jgi:hypothetical protein
MKLRTTVLTSALLGTLALGACSSPPAVGPSSGEPSDPSQLHPPPQGQGVQLMTDAFPVPADTEIQACYFFRVSDLEKAAGLDPTKPLNVSRVQIAQKAGSHHMNLFRVRTIVGLDPAQGTAPPKGSNAFSVQVGTNGQGQCFVSSNWADWPLIANMQQAGGDDWSYPDGVANELAPCEVLMLQTHYVNAHTQQTEAGVGQVGINLFALDETDVKAQMGTSFAFDQNIRVCKDNPTPAFGTGVSLNNPEPVTIIGANGHFHSRGKEFDIFAWDGKTPTPDASSRFYQSLTWNEPPMLHSPNLAVQIPAMGGFYYQCSYDWQDPAAETSNAITCATLDTFDQAKNLPGGVKPPAPDCCYRFGPQVDLNEHCNAFVYYYPGPPLNLMAPNLCH